MPVIRGQIEQLYKNQVQTKRGPATTTNFVINGNKYSGGFKEWNVERGDEVEVTYKVNANGYNDVTKMDVVTSGGLEPARAPTPAQAAKKQFPPKSNYQERTFPVGPLDPARAINRQNALTNAVNYTIKCAEFSENDVTPESVIDVARVFEAYTTGDLDMQIAKELAGKE